jgi:hypothetical protein
MTAELVLGTDYLPLPARDGIEMDYIPFGGQKRMLDGTLRADLRGCKFRWTLRWEGLTQAERTALLQSYATHTYTQATVTLPNGDAWSVLVGTNSWRETQFFDTVDTPYYNVTFNLDQV